MSEEQGKPKKSEVVVCAKANRDLLGEIVEFGDNFVKTALLITTEMVVDDTGMAHSGFLASAAVYAAICAINDVDATPVECLSKFLCPIEKGKKIDFRAEGSHASTRTRDVSVVGKLGEVIVYEGDIKLVVLDKHPLSVKLTK